MFYPGENPNNWSLYQFFDSLIRIKSMDFPHIVSMDFTKKTENKE
jgi:hypothetical protein